VEQIIRKLRGQRIVFEIYTPEEANERGIPFKPWKECKPGEYGLSDDGFVGVCLKRKTYTNKKGKSTRAVVFMAYGGAWVTSSGHINFLERKANNSYSRTSSRNWKDTEAASGRAKVAVGLAVDQIIKTGRIDYGAIGKLYRPGQLDPAATAKRFFKIEKVRKMLEEQLQAALDTEGVTKQLVVQRLNTIFDLAEKKKDLPNMLRSTENFVDILQMKKPTIIKQTLELEGHKVIAIEGRLEEEEQRLVASKTTVGIEDSIEGKDNGQTEEIAAEAGD